MSYVELKKCFNCDWIENITLVVKAICLSVCASTHRISTTFCLRNLLDGDFFKLAIL